MSHDGREHSAAQAAPVEGIGAIIKAAVYLRMSTEHQQYSTANQLDVLRAYAQLHGMEVIKVYSDEGKSGLNIQGREGLAQMIRDVQTGQAEFSCILVYDVSVGAASRMPMKAPITNTSAGKPVLPFTTVPSNL